MKIRRFLWIFAAILALFVASGCSPDPDFYTNHGLAVSVGAKNNPGPRTIEFWTDQTILFWRILHPDWLQCMNNAVANTHAFFVDEDHVMSDGKKYAGLAHHNDMTIEISYGSSVKVRGVFIHELSHVFVGECGGTWTNDGSHAIFKEVNLQWLTVY